MCVEILTHRQCCFSCTAGQGSTTTLAPSACEFEVFDNCTGFQENFINYTDADGVQIDTDAAFEFYCGSKGKEAIQCLKDHADPRCGEDTYTGGILKIIAQAENQTLQDTMCQNKSSYDALMECQKLMPNLQPFIDCITGDTLNVTYDPTDPCGFFRMTLGCSYKYTDLMCPDQLPYFLQNSQSYAVCPLDLPTRPTALSCDEGMIKACTVAFNVPDLSETQAYFQFVCSDKGKQYSACGKKVNTLCNSADANSSLSALSTDHTSAMCSDPEGFLAFNPCFLQYRAAQDFVDCLYTNETLDACSSLKRYYDCNTKFILELCPSMLSYYQKTNYVDYGNCQIGVIPSVTDGSDRPEVTFFFVTTVATVVMDFLV